MSHEPLVRLGFFFSVFLVMAVWEIAAPRRRLRTTKGARWPPNLGILVLDRLVVRILFPAAAVGMAILAAERGWGLLNNIELPAVVSIITSILVLDLVIYLQHVMFHAVPVLWMADRRVET